MKTICELRFADGQVASAAVDNNSPQSEAAVSYGGASARIVPRLSTATNATLRALCENISRATGAELSVRNEGQFEEFAE